LLSVSFLNSFAIREEEVPEPDSQLTCSTGDTSMPSLPNTKKIIRKKITQEKSK
jgi:hypothetical protein